jgi:radical SAM protein with 4Fe4S-binding SPASM domain
MPLELFELILSRLGQASPEWVALNHYGEPLLDPHFRERVRMLRAKGFPLYLFTNGTLLKDSTVDFLCEGGLYEVTFNFPSLDPDEWCDLMQMKEKFYWNARRGIERFLSLGGVGGGGASISVNARTDNSEERVARLEEHFSAFGPVRMIWEDSNSRASAIENQLVRIDAKSAGRNYGGCERFVAHLHVSWEGQVYLCCQDYEQQTVLGDIRESSISSIMTSDPARQLRAEMFGQSPMAAGRLCLNCNKLRTERFPL